MQKKSFEETVITLTYTSSEMYVASYTKAWIYQKYGTTDE